MRFHKITFNQALASIVLFNFGSTVVMGISTTVEQDTWIPILLAAALAVPLFIMYARIIRLFPGKDLFEILEILFGAIGGKILIALFTWYPIHLGALVLRNFSEFTQISAMPETPQLPMMILMVLTTIYLASHNMKGVGKWSTVALFFIVFVVVFTTVAAIPHMKHEYFLPFFEHSPAEITKSAFEIFAFPYAESVVFLCMAGSFQKKDSPRKIFLYSLLIIVVLFLLIFVRNLSVLGPIMMRVGYFPSYVAVRIIEIGDFFNRIEGSISSNLVLAGIVKISVCVLASSKGICRLFHLEDYRNAVVPAGMLSLAICAILYKNTMDMFRFLDVYSYYAFLFQVIIPAAVWITGEIRIKKRGQKADGGSTAKTEKSGLPDSAQGGLQNG